jgi:RimJ/RimL family protein N-acetyltransferase
MMVERLTTARLVLRRPTMADTDAMYAYTSDPAVTKYMGWPRHESKQTTRAFIVMRHEEWETRGTGTFLVEKDGVVVGSTGLHTYDDAPAATGYIIARPHWGNGYATEATRAVAEWAFGQSVAELFVVAGLGNVRAVATARRVGMAWVGETDKYWGMTLQAYRLRPADLDRSAEQRQYPGSQAE